MEREDMNGKKVKEVYPNKDIYLAAPLPFPEHDTGEEHKERVDNEKEYQRLRAHRMAHPDVDDFMQNPNLYSIGIKNGGECYNMGVFFEVFFRGLFDGLIIYFTVWKTLAEATQSNGHEYGMFATGMSVFCASCLAANFWLLIRFN